MNEIKQLQENYPSQNADEIRDSDGAIALITGAPHGEIAAPAPAKDPVRVLLAGYASARSRQTMLEAVERIARVAGVPAKRMVWHRLGFAHTSAIKARLEERYAKATVEITMVALRKLLLTCYNLGLMGREDLDRATTLGANGGALRLPPGRALDDTEFARLVAYCEGQRGPYRVFLRALFAMIMGAGLRATEVCRLPVDGRYTKHPDGTGTVRLFGKGNKEALQRLGPGEVEAIDLWLLARAVLEPTCQWMFVRVGKKGQLTNDKAMIEASVYEICQEVAVGAGIVPFMPHDLRRTYATRLFCAGYDLSTVQTLMRHASPETTRKYDRRPAEMIDASRLKVEMWPTATKKKEGGSTL
jgi:integrase/recombinase XerD